jgi:hypothetical protein
MIRISTMNTNRKTLLVGASAGVIVSRQFGLHSCKKLSTICEENSQKPVQSKVIPPRNENITQLSSKQFDVLIVGGGATGCKFE